MKTNLEELARHYHAAAQKSGKSEDYQEAVRWYRDYLTSFPHDPQAAQNNFLLAELLYEDKRYAEAAVEYEKSAYDYPKHAKAADAGYAALLAYAQQEKRLTAADLTTARSWRRSTAPCASRGRFAGDPRAPSVLTNAAEQYYALGDNQQAVKVARQVLALKPPAARRAAPGGMDRGRAHVVRQGRVRRCGARPTARRSR